ncbi:hypothetical protein L7F22_010336 [Adiantum nelumboides]|nr:hypothetical protein [Adiantum nelumboides]
MKGWVLTDFKKAEGQSVSEHISLDGEMVECDNKADFKKAAGQSVSEHMISLDCKMVECDDKTKGLVRVCAIDAEYKVHPSIANLIFDADILMCMDFAINNTKMGFWVLVDMLVKPESPVIDYLTPITGIFEADLRHVTCGFHEAQAILGYEFREDDKPHDCVIDATIQMKIVHHVLKHGIKGPIDIQTKMLDEGQLCKLYFHSIPQPVSVHDLQKLIPQEHPCLLDAISWSNAKYGTTFAVFTSIKVQVFS